MKKLFIKVLIGIGILGTISVVLNFSGALKLYTIPTPSNEPNLKVGQHALVSNLKQAKSLDFITYNLVSNNTNTTYIKRLIAKAGDTLEIIDGVVYVNRINMDQGLNLGHAYFIDEAEYNQINKEYKIEGIKVNQHTSPKTYMIHLPYDIAKKFNLGSKQLIREPGVSDDLNPIFSPNWNSHNFGPIVIPPGKNFVMGDSRDNSHDSRFTGYVDDKDITGVVVTIF